MSVLSNLIRKRDDQFSATAIAATHHENKGGKVAGIATVAVANTAAEKTAPLTKSRTSVTVRTSGWWLIHYPDCDPMEVACCPEASRDDVFKWYPDAMAVEPFTPRVITPDRMMTNVEIGMISRYCLAEKCQADEVQNILNQCQDDADARVYFLRKAKENLVG